MGVVHIATNFNIDIEFSSPAFYRRLCSWAIDMVVQIIYLVVAIRFYGYIAERSGDSADAQFNLFAFGGLLLVPFFIYHLICEITMNGQSIGKKIVGIRVIAENGGKPTIGQYIIRWLIRTSDVFLLILIILIPSIQYYGPKMYFGLLGSIALLFTDIVLVNANKQQRLGDILAHTILINTRRRESLEDTIFLDISDRYVPSFPQVMQLSDRDINSLKGILDTARKRHDFQLAEMASEKIRQHLRINTTLSPFDFLEVLLKDYNYLSSN